MCAVDLPDGQRRDEVLDRMFREERTFLLGCGTHSVRFRPALTIAEDELDAAVAALDRVLTRVDR
jgi:L-lysine 6-transaminase